MCSGDYLFYLFDAFWIKPECNIYGPYFNTYSIELQKHVYIKIQYLLFYLRDVVLINL